MRRHSTAQILVRLAIVSNIAQSPVGGAAWPITYAQMPDNPDNYLTIYDTSPVKDGRLMVSGEVIEHLGVSLRIRGWPHNTGYSKALQFQQHWDGVRNATVNLPAEPNIPATSYLVQNITRVGGILPLGQEPGKTRLIWTLNGLVTLKRL
jgi:hypothetical protein